MGVGGTTKFLASWALPIGIAKKCGTLTVHIIQDNVPLLLPVEMLRALGMVLDMPKGLITWTHLGGSQSKLYEVGAGTHIVINIFDFPDDGWSRKPNNIINTKATSFQLVVFSVWSSLSTLIAFYVGL